MIDFWNRCEGHIVHSFRLDKYLGGDDAGAVYRTEYGEERMPAAIKLMQIEESEWQDRLTTWAALSQLSHPRLIRIFESGHCIIEGADLLFVVTERSEGSLAGVLPERCLTATEAREMLDAAVEALGSLHERGFTHGDLRPSSIVAVGEEIKLASDSIRRAIQSGHASPADDVWSLGVTVVESLTQRRPDSEAAIPKSLPQPFLDIARHCLRRDPRTRWSIAQIAARLHGRQLAVVTPPLRRKTPRAWMALYSTAGAILVGIAILLFSARDQKESRIVAAPAAAVITAPSEAPREVAPAASATKPGAWFVVAATYTRQKDAANRAQLIARRWPRFKAEVYAPPLENQKPYYLVILGGNLSQNAAAALQERARTAGVARDAYVTRFQR